MSGSIIYQNGIKNLSDAAVRISESIAPDVDSTLNQVGKGRTTVSNSSRHPSCSTQQVSQIIV